LIKFWWNNDQLKIAQKTLPFFRKKFSKMQKSGKSSGFLIFFGNLYKRAYSKTDFGTKNVCAV
jgi:hypothetical protein